MAGNGDPAVQAPSNLVLSQSERRGERHGSGSGGGGSSDGGGGNNSLLPPIHSSANSPGAQRWTKIRKQIQSGEYKRGPPSRQKFQRLQRQTSNVDHANAPATTPLRRGSRSSPDTIRDSGMDSGSLPMPLESVTEASGRGLEVGGAEVPPSDNQRRAVSSTWHGGTTELVHTLLSREPSEAEDSEMSDQDHLSTTGHADKNSVVSSNAALRRRHLARQPRQEEKANTSSSQRHIAQEHSLSKPKLQTVMMAEPGIAEKVAPLILFALVAYLWICEENATTKFLGIGATGAKYMDDFISFGLAPGCAFALRLMLYWRRKSAFETKKKQLSVEEKKEGIDWGMKTRVFVGVIGIGAFASPVESKDKDKDEDEGGPPKSSKKAVSLAQHDATNEFRDMLLLYANKRWFDYNEPPTKDLSLTLIDFGVVEVQGEDGKTHVEQRRQPLYLPLDPELARSIASGAKEYVPLGSNPKKEGKRAKANAVRQSDGTFVFLCVLGLAAALIGLTAAAATAEIIMVALLLFVIAVAVAVSGPEEYNGGVKKTARYITHGDSGEKVEHRSNFDGERYASLSQREDIQLAIVPSNSGDDSGCDGKNFKQGLIFLDIYGEKKSVFKKLEKLVADVMNESFSPTTAPVSRPNSGKLDGGGDASFSGGGGGGGGNDMSSLFDDGDNSYPAGGVAAGGGGGKVAEKKQLYWYDLKGWSRRPDNPEPLFQKKPIHGDAEYQAEYHQSFFHPQKDRILGIPGYSLVDKFQRKEGAYAIPGVQRKLNFLLNGPPGTGKSKFVRTLSMYLQRHVVSFSLPQVETEAQLITLLDNLKSITDDVKEPAWNMCYEDVIFVIEELDTDKRGICNQRPDPSEQEVEEEEPPPPPPQNDTDTEDETDGEAATSPRSQIRKAAQKRAKKSRKQHEKQEKEKQKAAKEEAPLTLGVILRQLDGGSEAPGRMMIMTTNRVEILDAAFKRPGRVKQIRMDNLAYDEFKQMILHFLPRQETVGHKLPTVELWTQPIDELAQMVMDDFLQLQELRTSDVDRRGLGLSPAMLEDCCINAESLEDLFGLLRPELCLQWKKAEMSGEPPSVGPTKAWPWHMHSLRVAVLYHLTGANHTAAVDSWPELQIRDLDVTEPAHSVDHDLDLYDVGVAGGGGSDGRGSRGSGSNSPPPQPRSPSVSKHLPKQNPADGGDGGSGGKLSPHSPTRNSGESKDQAAPGLKERTMSGGLGLVGRTGSSMASLIVGSGSDRSMVRENSASSNLSFSFQNTSPEHTEGSVVRLVREMLHDEEQLNEALECCRYDNSHQPKFFDLKYASEIWMGAPLFEMAADENTTLQMALAVLLRKLRDKWELALSTGDEQIAEMLETSQPPAIQTFKESFKPSAEWCEEWL